MTIIPLIFSPFLIIQFPASLSVCLLSPALPAYLNLSLGGAYPAEGGQGIVAEKEGGLGKEAFPIVIKL